MSWRGSKGRKTLPMLQAEFQQDIGNPLIIVPQDIFGTKKIAGNAAKPNRSICSMSATIGSAPSAA